MAKPLEDKDWVALAKAQYQDDGTLEIDEGAAVSVTDVLHEITGAYVAAWVWVELPEGRTAQVVEEPPRTPNKWREAS